MGLKPKIKVADFYILKCSSQPFSNEALEAVKKYLINTKDSKEAYFDLPLSLADDLASPKEVEILTGFNIEKDLEKYGRDYNLAMSLDDLLFCQDYFNREGRDPTLTELRMLDTYWSDHCRHSTFNTVLEEIKFDESENSGDSALKKAFDLYEETRREVYGENSREVTLMDMATIGTKALKKRGLLPDLDESAEVNACTIKIEAEFSDGSTEPWLLLFKNETHNHPTEIEPFGGAATCLGGAIRDPLSGRAIVYQAMRITGGGDPRAGFKETLPGKLPQIKIAREAALGYSSYGNQVGLAAGHCIEIYHPGFLAKRMELGAIIGAVPAAWVRREEPTPEDVVILVGGKTGRDGIGGASGSSMLNAGNPESPTIDTFGAEVPKGNAPEERKLLRLFRKAEVCRLIKRCNDFGAGGVSVAVSELAEGLDINLDAVPARYPGMDGTDLAISESQERMAVVCSAKDADAFIKAAALENLEAVVIANINGDRRLRMFWQGKNIVDLSREFLNSNGAPRSAKVLLKARQESQNQESYKNEDIKEVPAGVLLDILERELVSLRSGSRRGLQEMFDSSVGASSVLFPWGGTEQGTPECGMAALLPTLGKKSLTASLMTFGYDPVLMSLDPYKGAKGSVLEALAKYACLGGDPFKARLSFQEYFERTIDPESWGLPAAALLGALEAQLRLEVPAIGGKDSMSGNFKAPGIDLKVPPTLVAFAAGKVRVKNVLSGALSGKAGNSIILLNIKDSTDEWECFKANMKILKELSESNLVRAAYPVGAGGVAASLALMAFGNMCGVEAYSSSFNLINKNNYQGSILVEIDKRPEECPWVIAACTLDRAIFRIVQESSSSDAEEVSPETADIALEVLRRAYEYPLSQVYPQTSTGATVAEPVDYNPLEYNPKDLELTGIKYVDRNQGKTKSDYPSKGKPLVLLPVFPGTNGEWDLEQAFLEQGARTKFVIFRNCNSQEIKDSIKELEASIKEAQIVAFSGGENGNFVSHVLSTPSLSTMLMEFYQKRDGLILGIGGGFQALINVGLLPYGCFCNNKLSLKPNALGRHVSRMARTRVISTLSPWLNLEEPGTIHIIPVSNGNGRITVDQDEAEALFKAGQIPFCYADSKGEAALSEPDNPFGSAFGIEALCSPDGRILGKMGHSERAGEWVHINTPGKKKQSIFQAGVRYFN